MPGVGHFSTTAVLGGPWRQAIRQRIESGILLGICLGMQWLFEGSEEAPDVPGLGIVAGVCRRIDVPRPLKVPHVGWNSLSRRRPSASFTMFRTRRMSTHAHIRRPCHGRCTATTTHEAFAAVVEGGRVFGVQFHPEKSSEAGLRVLQNFVRLVQFMLARRIIACLDVRDGRVVKGINFGHLKEAGDPSALARRYNADGIDEVVILDVTATLEGRRTLTDTVGGLQRAVHSFDCWWRDSIRR